MIFISTGHFKKLNTNQVIDVFNKNDIRNIELSGGKYQNKLIETLNKKKANNRFQIHNYFPPPKKPKVINLASGNRKIVEESLDIIKKAIDISKQLKSKFYSFHAGFLIDLKPKDLGRAKTKLSEIKRSHGIENFLKNVEIVSNYAFKKGVKILLENNVIGEKNFKLFKKNPFLMADEKEIKLIMNNTPKNVGLLLDLAHLKVSSKILKFNKFKAHDNVKQWIKSYHISDNNGFEDTNNPISQSSWFVNRLKKVDAVTLEVYTDNFDLIKNQIKILKKFF